MALWSAEIKELEKLRESIEGHFPVLEKELEQLVKFDDPNVILLYSRRSLEVMITDLCECELKRDRGTEPLKGIIDKLHKERKVPDHIATSMHGLNDLSNYGTHPRDFDPEQVKPVLINLDIILKWYLKYKGFKVVFKPEHVVQTTNIKPSIAKSASSAGRTLILRPSILVAVILIGTLLFLQNRNSRKKWAKEKALNEIEQLVDKADISSAFDLVKKAGKFISKEPKFRELSSLVTSDLTIVTDPPGADVYLREYSDTSGKWKKLGRTPVINAKIPGSKTWYLASMFYALKIRKKGFEDIFAVTSTETDTLHRKLFRQGTIPPGMVYVEGPVEFFIDRYEVSNIQYKEFIDKGGYRNRDFWKHEFKKDGEIISWDEAMSLLSDKTGRSGPLTWEAGDYPEGYDDYPVSGISWYEAAAYAEFAGKSLPASYLWKYAATGILPSKIIPVSNFNNKGAEAIGKNKGLGCFGTYDMAGNVREWCWNEMPSGHAIRGGAWNDASYLFVNFIAQAPSFDRSEKNGFRCVRYIDKEKIPESYFQPVSYPEIPDYSNVKPADDNIFAAYKNQFLYDKTDLNPKIEATDTSNQDWTIDKITFNSAYGKERVITYLFLPANSSPPFQTLIFFPGQNATWEPDLVNNTQTKWWIDYFLKDGRAVVCPVYKGMYERIDDQEPVVFSGHQLTRWITSWVKDFSRSVDYLESRSDIDLNNLGYFGYSLGALMGGLIPAFENRLKVNILISGGIMGEGSMVSFVTRIKMPTLMLNGKYDYIFPLETSAKPFYRFLGTPEKDKRLISYDTDHFVPRNEMIKEVLAFCDKYMGPVNYSAEE